MTLRTLPAVFCILGATALHAAEPQAGMTAYVQENLVPQFSDATVQAAIRAANSVHGDMTEEQILTLDQAWRSEVGATSTPTITPVLESPVTEWLRGIVGESAGMITEIIVMDNRGLNVAVSDVTSDYWQGDEAKYLETYAVGPDAVHVSEIELDESSQTYQGQVSFTVVDANDGSPIGAVTVGLNAEFF